MMVLAQKDRLIHDGMHRVVVASLDDGEEVGWIIGQLVPATLKDGHCLSWCVQIVAVETRRVLRIEITDTKVVHG